MAREYFFKKGNKYSTGRPPGAKNQIGIIRNRILRVVRRRIMHEKDLETVSTTDLLKFLAQIMPKDLTLSATSSEGPMQYISNVPRDEIEDKVMEVPAEDVPNGDSKSEASSDVVLCPELHQADVSGPV